ncbi:MAG TPA: alpha/beta hydrolase [Chryseolinea sp.]|nr:alpha/beta hydrolase [Chryseolinea sp.]
MGNTVLLPGASREFGEIRTQSASHTHETAPTTYINVKGTEFAYRVFGKNTGIPIVFLQHFTGTLDNWDPAVTNELAKRHTVILFDNKGVGSSGGKTPDSVAEMANDAIDFINELGFEKVDLLGFSLGGFIAQHLAERYPGLIRKVILAGTGPKGGEGITGLLTVINAGMADGPEKVLRNIFFTKTTSGRAAGEQFQQRLQSRKENRDIATSEDTVNAQAKAIITYGYEVDAAYQQLRNIKQPVLIVNGTEDLIVPSVNSFILSKYLENSKLILWSDSGHGGLFQYYQDFANEMEVFLAAE